MAWDLRYAESGPWTFVKADELPTAFAQIPPASDIGGLRTSVAGTPEADDAVREDASARLAEVRTRLGHLRVDVNGELGEAVVTVDGEPWPDLGIFVASDPGIREVRLMRGAEVVDSEDADVPEAGNATVQLEVDPAAMATAPDEGDGGG